MTADTVYERSVSQLEERYAFLFRSEARAGLFQAFRENRADDRDYRRDCAVDAIERLAFDNLDWELVKATDISDIACEIADEVERDDWTGGGQ